MVKDKLIALCLNCKCCLAKNRSHCFICHDEETIEELCGCGNCLDMLREYEDRQEIRNRNRQNNFPHKE